MAIRDNKILSWTNPIVNEADRPQRTASEMKAVFDSNSNQLRQALNGLIDDLSQNGAAELPAAPLDGVDGATVEGQLAGLKQYADEREEAANQYTDERELAANQYADERESAANQYTDEREVATRRYADEREAAAKRYADSLAFESGSADMQRSVYDPQGKAQDVFAYADNAANSLRNELDEINGDVEALRNELDEFSALPSGGTDGQVLLKDGEEEGAAKWGDVQALPSGGSDGQVLVKTGDTEGAASWQTLYTYGTTDLTAGSSPLETGKLYFVYE